MAYADETTNLRARRTQQSVALAREWRKLGRAATFVAILTSPGLYLYLHHTQGWGFLGSLLGTFIGVVAFRGLIDVLAHKVIPSPSIYGAEKELQQEDIVSRRRLWYWRKKYRTAVWIVVLGTLATVAVMVITGDSFGGSLRQIGDALVSFIPLLVGYAPILVLLFLMNFLILFGPLVFLGIQQIKGYEPGDADWGVKLEDVRGQVEAKEEITRVVALWQSGEEFEKAGGKRERGVLFLGPPGTGKTMLSKAIATSFNCPFVSIPGSGFAQTFIGMDAVIVRFLARKAKKLAAKWGGQCIVFIDEIDAVGMRRSSLGTGMTGGGMPHTPTSIHDYLFFGRQGSITPDGELTLKGRDWREKIFASREQPGRSPYPAGAQKVMNGIQSFIMPGGMGGGGGGLALNQLLVVMDGIDDPPWSKRIMTNRLNTFLDAVYIVPRKIGKLTLRMPPPQPRKEDIYFIGACNVPLEMLDPALIRPGRMGRHVFFRTPIKGDRKDIFELYLKKVDHDADLDTDARRDELARMTNGYSPAMIEQVCSMALTYAHSEGRQAFNRADLVEAMTTIEAGTAVGVEYPADQTRATAIHEAGHAVASHVYMEGTLSTRLSIRMRGASLGHHQAIEKEERFAKWRHEKLGELVWTVGAMAAEQVFYDENSTGVSGDMASATTTAALMVGVWGMSPENLRFDIDTEEEEDKREEFLERFEKIGLKMMSRAQATGPMQADPIASVLGDEFKRKAAAQWLGQSYVHAWNLILANKDKVEHVADVLIERREMHGDEIVDLLDRLEFVKPKVNLVDDASWPKL
jgi:ATP-dependent Zn protease